MASLKVDIASEFTGAKAFNKAEKKIGSLEGSAKKLAKTLGLALGTAAILSFGKSAVKAFMEDEKSAAMLAQTVKNLGMAMELPEIESFISNMEKATGIADDKLRPAMQSLLTTFQNTATAQGMLGLATEISRGSGQDLSTVVADLTKAYTGQTKGLEKYKLGLSAAELKSMSFEQIMEKLNKQFKGSNAAYLETYAGKMEALGTAADTAKEIIGKGLVDALMAITGSINVQELSTKLIGFAQNLADAFVKIGNLIHQNWAIVKTFGAALIAVFTASKIYAGIVAFAGFMKKMIQLFKDLRRVATGAAAAEQAAINPWFAVGSILLTLGAIKSAELAIDAFGKTKDQAFKMPTFKPGSLEFKKYQAEQLKAAKLNAKIAADKAKRDRAALVFDMNLIQIIAALKGSVSAEDRKRLELQLALTTDNTTEVTRLTRELAIAQGYTKDLTDYLLNLPEANNPFKAWEGYLDKIEAQARRIAIGGSNLPNTVYTEITYVPPGTVAPKTQPLSPIDTISKYPSPNLTADEVAKARERGANYGSGNTGNIVVQIDGKEVVNAIVGQAMSGNNAYLNRRLGGFD
jgi:hypothetical protein